MNTIIVQFGSVSVIWSNFSQLFLPKNNRGGGQILVKFLVKSLTVVDPKEICYNIFSKIAEKIASDLYIKFAVHPITPP